MYRYICMNIYVCMYMCLYICMANETALHHSPNNPNNANNPNNPNNPASQYGLTLISKSPAKTKHLILAGNDSPNHGNNGGNIEQEVARMMPKWSLFKNKPSLSKSKYNNAVGKARKQLYEEEMKQRRKPTSLSLSLSHESPLITPYDSNIILCIYL